MTENESIKQAIRCVVGACDETCPHYWSDGVCHGYEEVAKGLEKALEEIQQYRAIGTVKGYERAIEISIENYNLYKEYKAKVQDFEAIGTVEEFKALKEKSVAKKPLRIPDDDTCIYYGYYCPCCNEPLSNTARMGRCFCGQKLDWS